MSNNSLMQGKHAKRRVILQRIYDLLDVGVESREVSSEMFADKGVSGHTVGDYVREMESIGILSRRMEYGSPTNGMKTGRHYHWTLLVPMSEALKKLDVLDAAEIENVRKAGSAAGKKSAAKKLTTDKINTAVRLVDNTPVEAISGPDAPSPFDVLKPYRHVVAEPYALVEAARQYASRDAKMEASIKSLIDQAKELGMDIDEQILRDSVSYPVIDDRLNAVALVLPYITQLESAVARLIGQVEGLKEQVTELNKARMEITALRGQNERLIAKIARTN